MNNEVNNNVNDELNVKSNNNSKIIIIILVVLLICALGFICYDKFINKEKPPVPTPSPSPTIEPTNNEEEQDDLEEWMTYLLNQNIKSVSLNDDIKHKDLTVDDLRLFLQEFNSHKHTIKKIYSGTGDSLSIQVTYFKDGKEYIVRFMPLESNVIHVIFDSTDKTDLDLINLLDKVMNESAKATDGLGIIYEFTCLDDVKYSVFESAFE